MYRVHEMRIEADHTIDMMYLHAFRLLREAKAFDAKWRAANPGRFTHIDKV